MSCRYCHEYEPHRTNLTASGGGSGSAPVAILMSCLSGAKVAERQGECFENWVGDYWGSESFSLGRPDERTSGPG